jgi:hypothetical protein
MLLVVQSGVDVNSWHRVLLRSAKPVLHANVNCTPLIAAIVARQDVVVKYLLEVFGQLFCQPTQNMLIIMCLIELLNFLGRVMSKNMVSILSCLCPT